MIRPLPNGLWLRRIGLHGAGLLGKDYGHDHVAVTRTAFGSASRSPIPKATSSRSPSRSFPHFGCPRPPGS